MTPAGDGEPRAIEKIIDSYLDIDGVTVAALVSADGLIVASAGSDEYDLEAFAAIAATVLSSARGLANEDGAGVPRLITLDLNRRGLILAPLAGDLFLLIAGDRRILSLAGSGAIPA